MNFDVEKALAAGEGHQIEFKKAEYTFPNDAFKTISAFANSDGGLILLGVGENRGQAEIVGVQSPDKIKGELFNALNNKNKVSLNIIANEDVIDINYEGKNLIGIRVRKANYKEMPVYIDDNPKKSFHRQGSGDFQCTYEMVQAMMRDAAREPYDSLPLAEYSIHDFDMKTVNDYRSRFASIHGEHIYLNLVDEDFLLHIKALTRERKTNKIVPTLAGLLVFGKHIAITEYLPHYHIEYINKTNIGRNSFYSDRLIFDGSWEDNLYNFFFKTIDKLFSTLSENSDISEEVKSKTLV